MTLFGKLLVYLLVVMSLVGSGLALWVGVDHRNWNQEAEDLKKEIRKKLALQDEEEKTLRAVLGEIKEGKRQTEIQQIDPKDAKQPPQLAPLKTMSVAQARQEITKGEAELAGLAESVDQLFTAGIPGWLDRIKKARKETEAALTRQKELREAIEQPKDPPQKSFRTLIEEAAQAKKKAEDEQEKLRPHLFQALEEVSVLAERREQLLKRVDELKGQ